MSTYQNETTAGIHANPWKVKRHFYAFYLFSNVTFFIENTIEYVVENAIEDAIECAIEKAIEDAV